VLVGVAVGGKINGTVKYWSWHPSHINLT
jgi:hypothetical protein